MLSAMQSLKLLENSHHCLQKVQSELSKEWSPDEAPATLVSSSMAKRVILEAGNVADTEMKTISDCIEKILSVGNDNAKDVIATGFLEAVVAADDEGSEGAARLMKFLGPRARVYCQEWKSFTENSTTTQSPL